MGQYYKVFNLTAQEKLYPRSFDDGVKLMEFGSSAYGTLSAIALLLATNSERRGPWAGARLVVSGDYADEGKFVPAEFSKVNLYSYDYGAPANDAPEGTEEDVERFKEVSAVAKKLGAEVLPASSLFLKNSWLPGEERLFNPKTVVHSVEEFFEMFNVTIQDPLSESISDVMRSLRCSEIPSSLSWNYRVRDIQVKLTENGEEVESLTVHHHRDRGEEGPLDVKKSLRFPATSAQIRDFVGVTVKEPPQKRLRG